jgi:hypothetical protein
MKVAIFSFFEGGELKVFGTLFGRGENNWIFVLARVTFGVWATLFDRGKTLEISFLKDRETSGIRDTPRNQEKRAMQKNPNTN